MVLSLITPAGANFIKDFPGQNATNCDRLDEFAGPCLTSHPLRSFTPGLTSTGTAPNLGTGGISQGYYYKIWDQIYMWGEFKFGTSGINVGTDIYVVTLPFTVNNVMGNLLGGPASNLGAAPMVGVGCTFDASANAGALPVTVHLRTTTSLMFGIRMNSGSANRELRSSGYIAWDVNDGLAWSARVQEVPS